MNTLEQNRCQWNTIDVLWLLVASSPRLPGPRSESEAAQRQEPARNKRAPLLALAGRKRHDLHDALIDSTGQSIRAPERALSDRNTKVQLVLPQHPPFGTNRETNFWIISSHMLWPPQTKGCREFQLHAIQTRLNFVWSQ
jgi:hypothetical protein